MQTLFTKWMEALTSFPLVQKRPLFLYKLWLGNRTYGLCKLLHLKLFICSHFSGAWYGTEMWQPFCCLHTVYLLLPKVLMICKTPTFVRRKSSKCPCHLKPFFSSFFCQINALGNSSVVIHIFFSFEANWSVKNHVLPLVCDTHSVDC